MKRAIRKHWIDFAAIIGLIVISAGVASYILSNQRFYLPAWVPVIGTDFFTINGEFRSAKSVTPGQGQTVTMAGVNVGDITKVTLVDGRARIEMKVRRRYADRIRKDATMLLRPKTGLEDMVVELDAGHDERAQGAGELDRAGPEHAARRQVRRDPRVAGPRHPRLPAPAGRRRGRRPARDGRRPRGHVQALRAGRARTCGASARRSRTGAATSGARSTTCGSSSRPSARRTPSSRS